MLESHEATLPHEMQTCLRACLETGQTLRRHQAIFTTSSSALAQLLHDWSRRQIMHHLQNAEQLSPETAAEQTDYWLRHLAP